METEILSVMSDESISFAIPRAKEVILGGGLVVFPTETVYGLGADATNMHAAEKIYRAKARPSDNPLIIHIASPEDAEEYTYTCETYYALARAFMPGPLTVILPAKDTIPLTTRGGLETVAVRCPSNEVARALISACGVPIAAPSANLSGSPSPTVIKHVIDDMKGRCDMILDGGDCEFGLESTIVQILDDQSLRVLRPGKITPEDLQQICPNVLIAKAVTEGLGENEAVLSPGMKYRHYAPAAPMFLLNGDSSKIIQYIRQEFKGRVAIIAYHDEMCLYREALPEATLYDFGKSGDEIEQAHSLYYILREADKENYDTIYAPMPSKEGIGLALYNRMIRAAAYQIIDLN